MATLRPMPDLAPLLDRAREAGVELWTEGPRLRFRAPPGALTDELRELLRSQRSNLVDHLQQRAALRQEAAPLAPNQRGLWFLHRLVPTSSAYNVAFAARLHGAVNVPVLIDAWQVLVDRHEGLRSVFPPVEGAPQRVTKGYVPLAFEQVDARGWTETQLRERVDADYARPFDLEHGPIVRASLYDEADDRHVLLVVIHHIAIDGTGLFALLEEFFAVYEALLQGSPVPTVEDTASFSEFVSWQESMLTSAEADRSYWSGVLHPPPLPLPLPTDRPRQAISAMRGRSTSILLDAALSAQVRKAAAEHRSTEFVFLLTAWFVFLHRLTGHDDVTVGTPVLGRPAKRFARTVGNLVNTLPLRVRGIEDPSFAELLAQVRGVVLEGMARQDFPLSSMVEQQSRRTEGGNAPFQTLFLMQDFARFGKFERLLHAGGNDRIPFGALTLGPYSLQQQEGQFELAVDVWPRSDGLLCVWKYDTELFDRATVDRLARRFATLVQNAAEAPATALSQLEILPVEERRFIIEELNATAVTYPPTRCLHELIEEQVDRTPDAIAVRFEERQLTYRELDLQSNQLAHELRASGVGPDTLVGICMERSIELVVGLLAILKAGGAYVPMDPSYPRERLAYMLEDAGVSVLLTQEKLSATLPPHRAKEICVDQHRSRLATLAGGRLPAVATPENLAYMIYTSGSTGRPKGALNEHRGIVNRLRWMQAEYQLTAQDSILQKTPFSFDVSVWEFFWPLIAGARLVVAQPGRHGDPGYLVEIIERERITITHFVPSMLRIFLESPEVPRCQSLRDVMCSGEALPADIVHEFHARLPANLHNLYGPTEAAVDVTYWPCPRTPDLKTVPIGRPVANTQCYILDRHGQPVPLGIAGELHLGGIQVGRGYHRQPGLTAEKFIANPFSPFPGARLYRTGDLCRFLPDGNIEYLGRIDHQVKIRGFRIELGEIESGLLRHPAVKDTVVVALDVPGGDKRLVAYWVAAGSATVQPSDLRHHLAPLLPDYMIPAAFVRLDRLPLSPNGKIDRKALPAPGTDAADAPTGTAFEPPATATEQLVAEIFSDVLRVSPVGRLHHFFELGGHSLLATRAVTRIGQRLNRSLPLRTLFDHPSVGGLALHLDQMAGVAANAAGRNGSAVPQPQERFEF